MKAKAEIEPLSESCQEGWLIPATGSRQMRWGNTLEHTDHGDRQSGGRGEHKEKTQEVMING